MPGPRLFLLSLSALLALTSSAPGQGRPSEFLEVVQVTVKPSGVAEYEDYLKTVVAAANKVGAPNRALTYQLVMGGPGYTYFFAIHFDRWDERESWPSIPEVLRQAYGDMEGGRILSAGRAPVERSESAVYRLQPDLGTRLRLIDPPSPYMLLVRTEVHPELASAYEIFLAKLKTAEEKEPGSPTGIRRVSVLGVASTYQTARPFSKHAERAAWPGTEELLRKAYGEAEAAQLIEGSLRAVRSRFTCVLALRPDLSRPKGGPAPTTSDK